MESDVVAEFLRLLDEEYPVLTDLALVKAQTVVSDRRANGRFLEDLRRGHAEFTARAQGVEALRRRLMADRSPNTVAAQMLGAEAIRQRARTVTARADLERLQRAAKQQILEAEKARIRKRVEESPVTVLRDIVRSDCSCGCSDRAAAWLDAHTRSGAR